MASASTSEKVAKIPLWFGDPSKDSLSAEHWVRRMDNLKRTQSWTDEQTAGHAYNAFRGKALGFIEYIEKAKVEHHLWSVLRQEFLTSFGSQVQDTSRTANLTLLQRSGEGCQFFAFRVQQVINEFALTIPENDPPIKHEDFSGLPAKLREVVSDPAVQGEIALHVHTLAVKWFKEGIEHTLASIGRNVFLNGLLPSIRSTAKLQKTLTLKEAAEEAAQVERAVRGPTDKLNISQVHNESPEGSAPLVSDTDALTRSEATELFLNFMKKHFSKTSKGRRPQASRQRTAATECWYCHKKNHIQSACRLRIARGASMVTRPRTVHEIETDRMLYQDSDDSEESEVDTEDEAANAVPAGISTMSLNC